MSPAIECLQCGCCGLGLDVQHAECGHLFCYFCRERGHDKPCKGCGHPEIPAAMIGPFERLALMDEQSTRLLGLVRDVSVAVDALRLRMDEARKDLATEREALHAAQAECERLRRYAQHTQECLSFPRRTLPCTCGLTAPAPTAPAR